MGSGSSDLASVRRPRPWAAPLARPAARIALAGGLTLAGWLLGALVAGAGAEAAEQPHGLGAPGNTVATAPGHTWHGEAREHRREPRGHPWHGVSTGSTADSRATGTSGGSKGSATGTSSDSTDSAAATPNTSGTSASDESTPDTSASDTTTSGAPSTSGTSESDQAETPASSGGSTDSAATTGASQGGANAGSAQVVPGESGGAKQHETGDCDGTHHSATDQTTTDTTATDPATAPSTTDTTSTDTEALLRATPSQGGLLGGVLGLVDNTVHSITGVAGTVGDVGDTVLPTVTTVPGADDAPPLIPIGDVLGPVFSGGTVSGGVTATVPELTVQPGEVVSAVVPVVVPQPAPMTVPKAAALVHYPSVVHLIPVQQRSTGAQHANNENSHVGVTGGGGSGGGGGLPAAPSAPVAPTTTVNPGHDGSGGARQPFAVVGDSVTTTQLKLIGVSRDHEVDGAGRDAALPTTSPD
ncbi:hypothetical protein [Amycolatopsis sp. DSM 110486]|uniref:hypothetical protein n=1 Tax=Amycolatopsis sp. DSM 110486 TaxID=2865832 RepID=UPI001C6A40F8|nr:hypothetical protein [Amycolatopsis sp. DSM 110486]QYN24663.1 hypothetical protein K1T34_20810 [Amycolatopsis sp. DSM 110486]